MPRSNKKRSPLKPPTKHPTRHLSVFPSSKTDQVQTGSTQMVRRAVSSAKKHGENLIPGTLNAADGNCAFESAIFNVNDRDCFLQQANNVCGLLPHDLDSRYEESHSQ
jgi:hypothetical protein